MPDDGGERITFVWAGTLADTRVAHDFLHAVATLPEDTARRMRLVICGRGGLEDMVRELAADNAHIAYPGWVDRTALAHLLARTDYGVIPYERSKDFQSSIPNKVSEYLSAGAHILTTLDGYVRDLLGESGVVHVMPPDRRSMRAMMIRLTRNGKLPMRQKERARDCYQRWFDSAVIYPAMADHVESMARHRETAPRKEHDHAITP